MQRQMLKSKIHRATVTDCDVDYVGSLTLDPELMRAANMLPNEQVHVWDIENAARFVTYVIEGEPGSGTVQVNGAAARLVQPGHKVIVASFGDYDERDLEAYSPVVVHVDDRNEIVAIDSDPSVLLSEPAEGAAASESAPPPPASAPAHTVGPGPQRQPLTVPKLAEMKRAGDPIVMVTAYDFPSAQIVEEAGVDVVLVGDTAAMVVLGHDATTPVGMDEMVTMTAAVRRGLETPLLIGDLPFGSYEASNQIAVESAQRFVREAGVDAVKLERGGPSVDRARAIIRSGIPVMGHVGLTPQTATALGGFRAQGKTAAEAEQLAEEALALQSVGCFAIVFEAIPAEVTEALMPRLEIPVIGIGAGPATDGQVLVWHDLLGLYGGHQPKFVKKYAEIRAQMLAGVSVYTDEVRARTFPTDEHTYSIDPDQLAEFKSYLEQESLAATTPWDW